MQTRKHWVRTATARSCYYLLQVWFWYNCVKWISRNRKNICNKIYRKNKINFDCTKSSKWRNNISWSCANRKSCKGYEQQFEIFAYSMRDNSSCTWIWWLHISKWSVLAELFHCWRIIYGGYYTCICIYKCCSTKINDYFSWWYKTVSISRSRYCIKRFDWKPCTANHYTKCCKTTDCIIRYFKKCRTCNCKRNGRINTSNRWLLSDEMWIKWTDSKYNDSCNGSSIWSRVYIGRCTTTYSTKNRWNRYLLF